MYNKITANLQIRKDFLLHLDDDLVKDALEDDDQTDGKNCDDLQQ